MPRRTIWLAAGALVGAGSSLYAERKVRRTLEQAAGRLRPDALVVQAGSSARQAASATGGRLREAVASGRVAMVRREQELWASLDPEATAAGPPEPAAGTVLDGRVVAPGSVAPGTGAVAARVTGTAGGRRRKAAGRRLGRIRAGRTAG